MEDWTVHEIPYSSIGSVNEKILTHYQPYDDFDYLDEYQLQILLLLLLEGTTKCSRSSLSFQGIKRKLEIHQQILTNALNRLMEKDLIIKRPDNHYILTQKGFQFIKQYSHDISNPEVNLPTLESDYFTTMPAKIFLDSLKGKWFGDFRWIGWFQDSDSVKCEWISDDNTVEAVAWHKASDHFNDNSHPYLIKTILFQKTPKMTPEELQAKADWFGYHFNKKLAKTGFHLKETITEEAQLQLKPTKNEDWYFQNCVN